MLDELLDLARPVLDHRPVRRIDAPHSEILHALERFHVQPEVAVLVRDHGGRPVEDEIAAEERALLLEEETEVVGGVARVWTGIRVTPSPTTVSLVLQHLHVLGQARVPVDHLRDRHAGEELAELGHSAPGDRGGDGSG